MNWYVSVMILARFMVEGFRFGSRMEDPMSSDAVTSIDLDRSRNILRMEFDSRLRRVLSHMMSSFRISLFVTVDTMSCLLTPGTTSRRRRLTRFLLTSISAGNT